METRDQREKRTLLDFFIVIKELVHSILKCVMAVSNDYDI